MNVLVQAFAVAQGETIDPNIAQDIIDKFSELRNWVKAPASHGHIFWAMAAVIRSIPRLVDKWFEPVLNGLSAQLDPAVPDGFRAAVEGITWMVELGPDRIANGICQSLRPGLAELCRVRG
jgi:hypothetical protein